VKREEKGTTSLDTTTGTTWSELGGRKRAMWAKEIGRSYSRKTGSKGLVTGLLRKPTGGGRNT